MTGAFLDDCGHGGGRAPHHVCDDCVMEMSGRYVAMRTRAEAAEAELPSLKEHLSSKHSAMVITERALADRLSKALEVALEQLEAMGVDRNHPAVVRASDAIYGHFKARQ